MIIENTTKNDDLLLKLWDWYLLQECTLDEYKKTYHEKTEMK